MELSSSKPFLQTGRVARHFAVTRGPEVLVLQASPILGCIFGGFQLEGWDVARMVCLGFGSLALTAHIFVLNDWAGHGDDLLDPRRSARVFSRRGIGRLLVAQITIFLLIIAMSAFAALGLRTLLLGSAIAALSFLYSCSPGFGKRTPVLGSLNHLLGGALHFLLGYTVFHALDIKGLELSLFFGFVFAGGHLNQEVRDHDGDLLNGIRTSAVVFGPRPAFLASVIVFTAAYVVLAAFAAHQSLLGLLLCTLVAWLLHLALSLRALQRGLGFETAGWLQRRYRILLALVGLAMLVLLMQHASSPSFPLDLRMEGGGLSDGQAFGRVCLISKTIKSHNILVINDARTLGSHSHVPSRGSRLPSRLSHVLSRSSRLPSRLSHVPSRSSSNPGRDFRIHCWQVRGLCWGRKGSRDWKRCGRWVPEFGSME